MGDEIINIRIGNGHHKEKVTIRHYQKERTEPATYKVDGWEVKGLEKGLPQSYVEMLMRSTIEKIESDRE